MKCFNVYITTVESPTVNIPHMSPGKYLITLCTDIGYDNSTGSSQTVSVSLFDVTFSKLIPANSTGFFKEFKFCARVQGYRRVPNSFPVDRRNRECG